jgi:hypothetical protein
MLKWIIVFIGIFWSGVIAERLSDYWYFGINSNPLEKTGVFFLGKDTVLLYVSEPKDSVLHHKVATLLYREKDNKLHFYECLRMTEYVSVLNREGAWKQAFCDSMPIWIKFDFDYYFSQYLTQYSLELRGLIDIEDEEVMSVFKFLRCFEPENRLRVSVLIKLWSIRKDKMDYYHSHLIDKEKK